MPTRFRYRCIVDGETFNPWPRANTASFSRQKPVASRHALTWLANSPLNNPLDRFGAVDRRFTPRQRTYPQGCLPRSTQRFTVRRSIPNRRTVSE